MRTQPEIVIQRLEADNSRLAKEQILAEAMTEGLDEFFEGVKMGLDKLYTFGVKQVPVSEQDGQGLSWPNFVELAEALYRRELTGHAARDAVKLAMDVATKAQWNDWYRRILIKDMRAGFGEKSLWPRNSRSPSMLYRCSKLCWHTMVLITNQRSQARNW